jgi:UDP-N-acetylglucosamine 2-epimerase (non-hydrolysing)
MLDAPIAVFGLVPDYDLDVMRPDQTPTDVAAATLERLPRIIREFRPDFVLVQGDTTTTMAAAIAAFYERVPVGYAEAGLRKGDMTAPFPEEGNRKVTTQLAALHFAPTETSRRNLLAEGVNDASIHVTGNAVIDALLAIRNRVSSDASLRGKLERRFDWLDPKRKLILVTGHRRENFGKGFEEICQALASIANLRPDVQILYPVHLNPNVREPVFRILAGQENIRLIDPVDYVPFVYLMDRSRLIVTDSGGVQEEAPSLGKPVLVMREVTERPEAVEAGTVQLVGASRERIESEISRLLNDPDTTAP